MSGRLAASYTHCERVARQSASSFYYSFLLLPRAERRAMCAWYAYLRRTDDLGDNNSPVETRRQSLVEWRRSLRRAVEGQFDSDPLWPAVADTLQTYRIPSQYAEETIDGVEMDLEPRTYQSFAELEQYCYRVASVVGLACLKIWGCEHVEAELPARRCGVAFQLTNILRDLREDADAGRVYLPLEDMRRFGYSADELRQGVRDERFGKLLRFEIERCEGLYAEAAELEQWLDPPARRMLGSMTTVYRTLLAEIKRMDVDVLARRATLSRWRKMAIAARWLLLPTPAHSSGASAG